MSGTGLVAVVMILVLVIGVAALAAKRGVLGAIKVRILGASAEVRTLHEASISDADSEHKDDQLRSSATGGNANISLKGVKSEGTTYEATATSQPPSSPDEPKKP